MKQDIQPDAPWCCVQESKLFGWLTTLYNAWQHLQVGPSMRFHPPVLPDRDVSSVYCVIYCRFKDACNPPSPSPSAQQMQRML